ncbi:MAG: YdcF family protein [Clostridia bacterium]|nr:YdcF family protein [Clostridia bacterium]
MKKLLKATAITIVLLIVLAVCAVFGLNAYVKSVGGSRIVTPEEAAAIGDADCILVLGCSVKIDHTLSDMLADRLRRGVELYENGAAPKLLMSGDHGTDVYDEVNAMKDYATENGVPSSDVFMDHAGFSTYESVYRAKEIFSAKKVIIVTQEYHLYRALFIAEKLGLEAYGVASDYHTYGGQESRELREILARCKDFASAFFKPKPTYLGDKIPLDGDGNITNDR